MAWAGHVGVWARGPRFSSSPLAVATANRQTPTAIATAVAPLSSMDAVVARGRCSQTWVPRVPIIQILVSILAAGRAFDV